METMQEEAREAALAAFKAEILRRHSQKNKKKNITNSYGIPDYYKFYTEEFERNAARVLTRREFSQALDGIYKRMREDLANSGIVKFPYGMGEVAVTKRPMKIWFENGEAHTTKIIDWDATLNLWFEDEESRQLKRKVYRDTKTLFMIRYNSGNNAPINGKSFRMKISRGLKDMLKNNVKSGKVTDSFL